ncbi:TonB-linked SusC/RagA family outer membrane protein [Flavobacterium nitrogenifigens]|uniref:TonB-linked SusC/RagA family outer membrane protein n=2 Tax=Flavobacterium TaxID=237 RepID=A0A7W7J1G9_9FLAO|nr:MULTISPECIES: TonB-dependent receptor [Flavobacterium]MBB4804457.1 TonB-linked SusC/RagA family outer membrane protein [Flavobacterium nitrogenifigens]MBB6389415.1 TonB-linked SusC/RagA family outer membrane protein [Flavobacterium notoginsengisoli]
MKLKLKWICTLLVALSMQFSFAQERTVTGKVSDKTGVIPGVNVLVKGSKTSTQTDFDGSYSIKAKTGDVLIFSYVGMNNKNVTVGTSNTISVELESEAQLMNEVVVVGYGVQKRKEVTGSISKIAGKDIANLVTPSFEGVLAGRATGVQVLTNTGLLGAAPKIRIRGIGSISGSTEPLIVVDGIPIFSGDIGGVSATNGLADINPEDIESFDVLKDGAATAIYGSRAANGVILITTKSGKKGTLKVSYSSVFGVASAAKTYDLLQTPDFLVISNEKRTNAGQTPWAVGNTYNTDWQAAVLRNAPQVTHNLNFSGGSEKTKYYLSLGLSDMDGINLANSMKKYSIRTNIDQEINKWLSVGTNLAVSRTEYDGLNSNASGLSGNIFNTIRQLPNIPIYDALDPTGYNLSANNATVGQWDNTAAVGDNITNIMYVLDHNKYKSTTTRIIASAYANAQITKDLSYKLQISADNAMTDGFQYWNPIHGDGRGSNGLVYQDNRNLLRWNWQNILNYKHTFAENHNIGLTGVAEYQKSRDKLLWGQGSDIISDFFDENLVTNTFNTKDAGGGITEKGIISYLGRFTYNFKEKYFLQASLRRDGISQFESDVRYHNFPGVSAGWTVSKESFMEGISGVLSDLKFRGSYSEVGNVDVLNGAAYPSKDLTIGSPYGPSNGIGYYQFSNPLLQWETSSKVDFGVDLGFMNNRLTLAFDYFKNNIDNLVLAAPTSPSIGIPNNTVNQNVGKMYNQGYEFSLNFKAINTQNFSWDLSSNLTLTKNKVTALYQGQSIVGGSSTDTNIAPNIIIAEGESINSLYGFQYWGVNPANGNPVYYKADGSLVQGNLSTQTYFKFDANNPGGPMDATTAATLSTADKKILGNTLPTYYGSVSSNMKYKNIDFGFMFRFSGGNEIFNSTRRELMNQNFNNNGTEILGRWQSAANPGDGWTPRLYASSNTFTNLSGSASTRFVEKGDFISLDNITLGYTLPKVLLDKIGVDTFRLFVQGQNIWLISDYKGLNPEMETSGVDINGTPRAKVVSVGLNVSL